MSATSRRPGPPPGALLRSWFAGAALLGRRRLRRDLALLAVGCALTALTLLAALVAPASVESMLDRGASDAVASNGDDADLVATALVAAPSASWGQPVFSPDEVEELAEQIDARLPPALNSLADDATLSVLGAESSTRVIETDGSEREQRVITSIGMLTESASNAITLVAGSAPTPHDDGSTGVIVSTDSSERVGLDVGSALEIPGTEGRPLRLVVDGIAETDASATAWHDLPSFPAAEQRSGFDIETVAFTVLAEPEAVVAVSRSFSNPFTATIRVGLDPRPVTARLLTLASEEYTDLAANSAELTGDASGALTVRSQLPRLVDDFTAAARSAAAAAWTSLAGLLVVAGAVSVMLAGLLVARRRSDVLLERARGASVASLTLRSLLGSIMTTALAALVALTALVAVVLPSRLLGARAADATGVLTTAVVPVLLILAVALLAPVVSTALLARDQTPKRSSTNPRDRRAAQAARRARRIIAECTVALLAAASVAALLVRGPAPEGVDQVDPLLAAAPLLVSATATLVVLRLHRPVVSNAALLASRSRSLFGAVAAATTRRPLHVLPLFALTLAAALATGGALVTATVDEGADTASWQSIGADARIDASVTDDQIDEVTAAPGVSAATALAVAPGLQIDLGTTLAAATVVAVDDTYPALLAELPADVTGSLTSDSFAGLDTSPGDAALSALVDRRLEARLVSDEIIVRFEGQRIIRLTVVGTLPDDLPGIEGSVFVVVDRDALAAIDEVSAAPDVLLATGSGAADAVAEVEAPGDEVSTRAGWLAAQRGSPLIQGVSTISATATLALAALALIALLATALTGSKERGRTLSLLRTLGASPGVGWSITLSELAPLVLASAAGGAVAGAATTALLAPAMALERLTGGESPPQPSYAWPVFAILLAAALGTLFATVLIEHLTSRRARLSEVLRVGESS